MGVPLVGKPIAITGASSGIGAATALACARAGMPVALGARRTDKLEMLAERIRAEGGKALVVPLDVTKPEQCQAFVDRTVETFGSLYSVFANAGYGLERSIHETSDQEMRDLFEVNFFGTLNTIRPALRHLLDHPRRSTPYRGHILICSSCVSKMALPYYGAYSATKAAQNHIGRAMKLELEHADLPVTTIHPIGTRTEFFDQVKSRSNPPGDTLTAHTPGWFMQTSDRVAGRVVAALRRPRPELWIGLRGLVVRLGVSVNTLVPAMADLTLRGMVAKRR